LLQVDEITNISLKFAERTSRSDLKMSNRLGKSSKMT